MFRFDPLNPKPIHVRSVELKAKELADLIYRQSADFNKVNPGRRITPPQLWQSVRNRERRIREADEGVYLPRTRRDVMDEGRFAMAG